MNQARVIANRIIQSNLVPNLLSILDQNEAPNRRILAYIWSTFIFKGLNAVLIAERQHKTAEQAILRTRLVVGDVELSILGKIHPQHVFSSSSTEYLSLTRKAFVLGQYEFGENGVEVWPYIIGDFSPEYFQPVEGLHETLQRPRLYPQEIDGFAKLADIPSPSMKQLETMGKIPEAEIKKAFSFILGEPFLDKDWGGEMSDIYTSRLSVGGKLLPTAFVLKGPGTPGPMYPTSLGKRGDQLVRAFDEPADLVVVQHHGKIETSVIKLAEALAVQPARPRRYCIIDGADTWRILKAYERLPA